MAHQTHPPGFHLVRRDQLVQEAEHDAYKSKGKLPEPTVCPDCGAVYHAGHWQWLEKPRMRMRIPPGLPAYAIAFRLGMFR
jgi:hypothetical protein